MQTEKKDNRKEPTKKQSLWEPVKIIIHKETKVAVRVSRLTIKPHPLYTYEIGYVDAEEQFHRFLKPKVEIDEATGKVELTPIDADAARWAMEEADVYIVEEVQKRENELQLQKKSRSPKKRVETKRHD